MVSYSSDAPDSPNAIGPYSKITFANGFAFLAGQIPLDPETMVLVEGGIEAQTERVMKNLSAVLTHAGLSFADVTSTTIYLMDFGHFEIVNRVYGRWLGDAKPARATVQVAGLPKGALVEISMIAALRDGA